MVNLRRGKGPGINGENSYPDSICACPNGWRLPKKEEIVPLKTDSLFSEASFNGAFDNLEDIKKLQIIEWKCWQL